MTDPYRLRKRQRKGVTIRRSADQKVLLQFDATIEEGHFAESYVTEHPVEKGFSITDHVQPLQSKLIISGWYSNTDIEERSTVSFLSGLSPYQDTGGANLSSPDRDVEGWDTLKRLWKDSTILDVHTKLEVYKNLVISSIEERRDTSKGQKIVPIVTFQPLRVVEPKISIVQRGPTEGAGKLQAKPASASEETRAKSMLLKMFGGTI